MSLPLFLFSQNYAKIKAERLRKSTEWFAKFGASTEAVYTDVELLKKIAEVVALADSLTESNQHFTIGVSETPNVRNRTGSYYPKEKGWKKGYEELSVVMNPVNVAKLEDGVIQHYFSTSASNIVNTNGGGGGISFKKTVAGGWTLYLKLASEVGVKPGKKWYADLTPERKRALADRVKERRQVRLESLESVNDTFDETERGECEEYILEASNDEEE